MKLQRLNIYATLCFYSNIEQEEEEDPSWEDDEEGEDDED